MESESLGCARCGDCCESIWVPRPLHMLIKWRDDGDYAERPEQVYNITFMEEHWHEVDTSNDGSPLYACDQFDKIHRLCMAHETRPPVCSDYPWYGKEPSPGKLSNVRCSYLLDLAPADRPDGARPLIPIEVIRRA